MKNKRSVILGLFLSLLVVSCGDGITKYEKKEIAGMVSVDVPDYMSPQDLENPEASFEYGNIFKEHYLMMMIETKAEIASYNLGYEFTLEDYADLTVEGLSETIMNADIVKDNETPNNLNGMPFYSYNVNGLLAEVNMRIYYYISVFESDKSFYVVYSWCPAKDKNTYKPDMIEIANSMKEI
jgi:hypothetical protein